MLLKSIVSGALALSTHFSCTYAAAIKPAAVNSGSLDPVDVSADGGEILSRPTRSFGTNNNIWMANKAGQSVYVMAAANPDWAVANFITDLALVFVGVTELKGVIEAAELPETIATVKDLYEFLKITGKLLSASVTLGTRPPEAALALHEAIKKHSQKISNMDSANVFHEGAFSKYLSASGLAGIAGASDVSLLVMSEDGRQVKMFNTNDDYSWIAMPNQKIIRSVYGGNVFDEDPSSGSEDWPIQESYQGKVDPSGGDNNTLDGSANNQD